MSSDHSGEDSISQSPRSQDINILPPDAPRRPSAIRVAEIVPSLQQQASYPSQNDPSGSDWAEHGHNYNSSDESGSDESAGEGSRHLGFQRANRDYRSVRLNHSVQPPPNGQRQTRVIPNRHESFRLQPSKCSAH